MCLWAAGGEGPIGPNMEENRIFDRAENLGLSPLVLPSGVTEGTICTLG